MFYSNPSNNTISSPNNYAYSGNFKGNDSLFNGTSKNIDGILAVIEAFSLVLNLDNKVLVDEAAVFNKDAQNEEYLNNITNTWKEIEAELQKKQSAQDENPNVASLGQSTATLDQWAKTLGISVDSLKNMTLTQVQTAEGSAEKMENNAGTIKTSDQTTVQMDESEFQTVLQLFSSMVSSFKSMCEGIASHIGS